MFPILNPPPPSLPIPSLWVLPGNIEFWGLLHCNLSAHHLLRLVLGRWHDGEGWAVSSDTFSRDQCFQTEKAMATHSSTLAWKIPWMEKPGRLKSKGLLRVRHNWATSLSLFTFMHWRRKWQPTPVFLPGESQGRESLVGCCLWGRTESDTTEVT